MNAIVKPQWHSIRQQVLDDARYANGNAHLESPEVPRWIEETGDHDIVGQMAAAISNCDEGPRYENLKKLFTQLCQDGDEISQRRAVDLLDLLRSLLTDECVRQAQEYVDAELGV